MHSMCSRIRAATEWTDDMFTVSARTVYHSYRSACMRTVRDRYLHQRQRLITVLVLQHRFRFGTARCISMLAMLVRYLLSDIGTVCVCELRAGYIWQQHWTVILLFVPDRHISAATTAVRVRAVLTWHGKQPTAADRM